MDNFSALAEQLKREGAAIEVRDAEDLARVLVILIRDPKRRRDLGDRAAAVAGAQGDALTLNTELVQRYW
jgi:3-deoxy-D-manno-octulosonic-acid transferase